MNDTVHFPRIIGKIKAVKLKWDFGLATLTAADQRSIDAKIEDIKLRTGFSYPDKSLVELASGEDIPVFEVDLSEVGPNISGILEYSNATKKSDPKIYINKKISRNRKVFTLAHELGHHFLHKAKYKLRLDDLDYSKADKDTKEESEANYFAGSLLVPKDLLLHKVDKGASISALADYFGVSQSVIETRLRWVKSNVE
jgi:Zn-dependent peptidase ImmA (M78 family)